MALMSRSKPRRRRNASSFIVTLGISAIDVLCCALVGGLVLFLILSQEGRNRRLAASGGANRDLIILLSYKATAPGQVLRLRLLPPAARPSSAVKSATEYWSDSEMGRREQDGMLEQGGVAYWSIPASSDAAGLRTAALYLHRPVPGPWGFSIGYVDATGGIVGVPDPAVDLTLRVFGSGTAECAFTDQRALPLNEVLQVGADGAPRYLSTGASQASLCTDGDLRAALFVRR